MALREAGLEGATTKYERLVHDAVNAGATDNDIDDVVHEVLQALFSSAEEPFTARELAHY